MRGWSPTIAVAVLLAGSGCACAGPSESVPPQGAVIRTMRRVAYTRRTYDLVLESGRRYWADGVLVDSSLASP